MLRKIKRIGFMNAIDDICGNIFSKMHYLYCVFSDKTYFGSYCAATQGKTVRHWYMQKLIEHYSNQVKSKIDILEIGSWAGGSAITWADAVKKYSKHGGTVICIDQWTSYLSTVKNKLWTHRNMEAALKTNRIYNLFLHNIKASKHDDIVFTFKGPSSQNLALLKHNTFDIIFIDGDHFYEGVKKDITASAPLVKNGGIICGDDLESQFSEIKNLDIQNLLNYDVAIDTNTGKNFHPGVTQAVYDFFQTDVSCWQGFWAMRKNGESWMKIELNLNNETLQIPKHLK